MNTQEEKMRPFVGVNLNEMHALLLSSYHNQ